MSDSPERVLRAVLDLHAVETRYTDSSHEWSTSTRAEAADWADIPEADVETFDVCTECGSIESRDEEDWDYRDSLWPCRTIRAIRRVLA